MQIVFEGAELLPRLSPDQVTAYRAAGWAPVFSDETDLLFQVDPGMMGAFALYHGARKEDPGYQPGLRIELDEEDAERWLALHRPDVAAEYNDLQELLSADPAWKEIRKALGRPALSRFHFEADQVVTLHATVVAEDEKQALERLQAALPEDVRYTWSADGSWNLKIGHEPVDDSVHFLVQPDDLDLEDITDHEGLTEAEIEQYEAGG